MNSQSDTVVLFFWALRHYLGKAVNKTYRQAKREYYTSLKGKLYCGLCGEKMSWNDKRTIDHIIPKSIIWETGLSGLYFDPRNFQASHEQCNYEKSSDVSELPKAVIAKLHELGYTS